LVALPTTEEQTVIATILSDMDAEIVALERRHKNRAIKQGMMQQLLTGRIRLFRPRTHVKRLPGYWKDRPDNGNVEEAPH
jgi:type I restriction enzyme S subunit